MSHADARFDDDGWQYGIRFGDGSIKDSFNGSTQRQRAKDEVNLMNAMYAPDRHVLVRRRRGGEWEEA